MPPLRIREYDQLLELALAILDEGPGDPPWSAMAESTQRLLHGGLVLIADLDMSTGRHHQVLAWTHDLPEPVLNTKVHQLAPAHPLLQLSARGQHTPLRVSDVLDRTDWRRTEIYRVCDSLVDHCVHHLSIPLTISAGQVRSILIGRAGRDFTDRELALGRRAQPLLVQIQRHATELQRIRQAVAWSQPAADPVRQAADFGLTPREFTVLSLMATGLTAAAIGRRLGVTAATASKHQENIYRKFGTRDRLTTVLTAQRLTLLPPYSLPRPIRV